MKHYQPTEADLVWARRMIELTAEGAVMAFPPYKGGHIYRFNHAHRELTLQNEDVLLQFEPGFVVHCMTVDVFAAVGYRVLPDPFV